MKRRELKDITNKKTKKRKLNKHLGDITQIFKNANLLTGNSEKALENVNINNEVDQQLSTFIAKSLAQNAENTNVFFNSFKKIDFNSELSDHEKIGYDSKERSILIPTDDETSPVTYLIHEGVHALDDLYMRVPRAIVNKLARLEQKAKKNLNDEDLIWWQEIQDILHNQDFNEKYNVLWAKQNLQEDFDDASSYRGYEGTEKNFQSADKFLENRGKKQNYEDALFQLPFNEITSHLIEGLYKNFDTKSIEDTKESRKILKTALKEVQNNFLKLDPKFSEHYPNAHSAFNERIFELSNVDKIINLNITTAEQYFQYRQEKRKNIKLSESPNITSFDSDEDKTKLKNLRKQYNDKHGDNWSQEVIDNYDRILARTQEVENLNLDRYQSPPVDTNRHDNYTQERSAEHIIDQTHHRLHNYEPHHYGYSSDSASE